MENYITKREEAYVVHNRILANGKIVQTALIDMCKDLKEMRDRALYTELGYESFEEYSEQACGIKQRQAYSYIAAYEKLGENYMEENAHLGITRLELISQISSYEREEFLADNDVEEMSTRELKKQVEEYKNRIEQLSFDLESANKESEELTQQIKDMQDSMVDSTLESSVDAVATVEPDPEIIKAAVDEAVKQSKADDAQTIEKLKAQVKEQKAKVKEITDRKEQDIKAAKKEALETANKKIDELVKAKQISDEKLQEALKSAKAANADEDVTAIRFLFTNLQSTANDIRKHLDKLYSKNPEQAQKLSSAMKSTLNSIIDSM